MNINLFVKLTNHRTIREVIFISDGSFSLEKYKINKLIVFIIRTLSIQFKLTLTDNYLNIESLLLRKI